MDRYNIAVIVTCYNRKDKTLLSLSKLFHAADVCSLAEIQLSIFLTDDGCTDGTADALKAMFAGKSLKIIQSDGTAYWAGGMRIAWLEALKESSKWDFYLLFNDDTMVLEDAFDEILRTHQFSLENYGKAGVYSGLISSLNNLNIITYGGKVYRRGFLGKSVNVIPNGRPVGCQMTNANFLLVSSEVVNKIGILDDAFKHACADWDYGIRASENGFPVLVSGNVCGQCDYDHDADKALYNKIKTMSISERKAYFNHPLHSTSDILSFMKRHNKLKYVLVYFMRIINIYFPKLYYWLNKVR